MVSLSQVYDTLFTVTAGKTVLFVIGFLIFLSFLFFTPITKRQRNPQTGKMEIVKIQDPRTKKWKNDTYSYPELGLVTLIIAIFIFGYNYATPQPPAYNYKAEIVTGNSSRNVSDLNYDRLMYISNSLHLVKLSTQDTPSRFDIDDQILDNNREYWQRETVRPYWDCSINTDGTWTWIDIELYFARNGANPIGEKHSHDFEQFYLYYFENETTPRYIAFPTFTGLTEHPKVLLKWSEVPHEGSDYYLRLDPSTNAFHERYDLYPDPNKNLQPTFVSADFRDITEYISDLERIVIYSSMITAGFVLLYMMSANKFRHKYFLLLFLLGLAIVYPLITLQYDFVGNPSFRVWEDGEKPDTSIWYESSEGLDYITEYGGTSFDRDRWTIPPYRYELGIDAQ